MVLELLVVASSRCIDAGTRLDGVAYATRERRSHPSHLLPSLLHLLFPPDHDTTSCADRVARKPLDTALVEHPAAGRIGLCLWLLSRLQDHQSVRAARHG